MSKDQVKAWLYRCGDCDHNPCTVEQSTRPIAEIAYHQFADRNVSRIEMAAKCGGATLGVTLGYGFFINERDEVVGVFERVDDYIKTTKQFTPYTHTEEISFDFAEWAESIPLQKPDTSL